VDQGLTSEEAATRLARYGANELQRAEATPPWKVLLAQFKGALIWLLLGACAVSAALGEVGDAIAIGAILLINAFVGFLQEYRAERAVLALRSMTAPHARVRRDGEARVVPAVEVVPGDVLLLEAGDLVAADARLLEAHALSTLEAALTGESVASEKRADPAPPDAPLAERHDRVFLGTAVATGTGAAEVTGTGMKTELGRIAHLLATAEEEETPLQRRLDQVGRLLLYLCLGLVVVVAAANLARGHGWLEVLMSSVSLAVAAVPEGLAAVVTIALAVGVQRMAARNVLVRKLPSVETLGSTTVICTDKTGTLTTGTMAVRELWGPDHQALLFAAAADCDAELAADGRGTGDPTELAILQAAALRGIRRQEIEKDLPRRDEHPFDSERKMMSVLRSDGVLYLKGAAEMVLPRVRGEAGNAVAAAAELASRGLRVLAVAVGRGDREEDLELRGLIGLSDPPRTEAIEAVRQARRAGVRTVMITGDHPRTAEAIAREMGLLQPGDDPREVVHARATPEDKLKVVRAWKAKGAVVAMTGDGVNDAPALKEAHIGIAMGKGGTEVTREASDMVLADDNYASIVAAVREGRGIYDNIQKTLVYLLAGNTGELLLMLGATAFGLPIPLLPLQLLWINLVTDGLPALALVMEPAAPELLERPPRPLKEPILGRAQWITILWVGALEATLSLAVFAWALRTRDLPHARNMAFSVVVFAEVLRALASRSTSRTYFEVGAWSNMRLIAVVVASVGLQLLIHWVPPLHPLFDIAPMDAWEIGVTAGLGLVPATALELSKLLSRQKHSAPSARGG